MNFFSIIKTIIRKAHFYKIEDEKKKKEYLKFKNEAYHDRTENRKQNTIKFLTYVTEQTHELQNNSVQMWLRKEIAEAFRDSFTLRAISSLLQ